MDCHWETWLYFCDHAKYDPDGFAVTENSIAVDRIDEEETIIEVLVFAE